MAKHHQRRTPVWTIMTDVGFQLFAVLCILVHDTQGELHSAKEAIVQMDIEREGLWDERNGLVGQLDDAEARLQNYAREGERRQGIIDDLTKSLGEQGQQLGQLTDDLNRLRPGGPIDIVIIVDCSQSMQLHHERLKAAQKSLFRWVSRFSSECRIGILGIRQGVAYRYPLTEIHSPAMDDGKSREALLRFMDNMQTSASYINHVVAIDEALAMLSENGEPGRKQALIVLGDAGPSELDGQAGYTPREVMAANRLATRVAEWANAGPRSVGTIYVGNEPSVRDSHWFRTLAHPSDVNFSTDSTDLFSIILKIIEQK